MTTRQATSLLPRIGDTPVIGSDGRSFADWGALLAAGAIQWPWLLRSLYGGRLRDKQALLDRLDLSHDALPHLGSWKADTGLLTLIADHILAHRPQLVVEFGTGASTLVLARALQKAGGGRRAADQLRPARGFRGRDSRLARGLRPQGGSARGAAAAVNGLAGPVVLPGGTVMLDDGARPGERIVARRWRRMRPDFDFMLLNSGTKGTLVGRRHV